MKFKDIRDIVLLSYVDGILGDDEFVMLYDAYKSKNPDFNHQAYDRFDLDAVDSAECKADFRIEKEDIPRLAEALQLPPVIKCEQRSVCTSIEALCLLLRRTSYPCRYGDLIPKFGRPVSVLSLIVNHTIDYIYDTHGQLITDWNQTLLNPLALQSYADAISSKGSPLNHCFGFIDGTVRPISRPSVNQRVVYNGHKRVHSLKFQSLALPNGLIGHIFGPVEGRRHDAGMIADSGLLNDLQTFAISPTGQTMCIYGDPAYPLRPQLQTPFRYGIITQQMKAYNAAMSSVRVAVEWLFGDIINSFKFLDFKKNLKIQLSSVGKMYVVCALLRNAITCLYPNQTSRFFDLEPPILEEYFQ